jgi:hypothetical protein
MSGQVFRLGFRKYPAHGAALKVMPAASADDEERNRQEIRTAIQASQLVRDGKSPYFPLVYGNADCADLDLPELPRTSPYYMEGFDEVKNPAIEKYARASGSPTGKIRGQVLISELAWGDLTQYIFMDGRLRDSKAAYLLIEEIFMAIMDLQEHMAFLHNDLRSDNILVVVENGLRPMPLIHDFGSSRPIGTHETEYIEDARKFLSSLSFRQGRFDMKHKLPLSTITHTETLRHMMAAFLTNGSYVEQYSLDGYRMRGVLKWWRENAKPAFAGVGTAVHDLI